MFFIGLMKLVPFRDWLYAAIAIAAITYYNVHVHNLIVGDEHKRDAAVQVESARVRAIAEQIMDAQKADYAAKLADSEARHEQDNQAANATHAADLQRLRQLAAKSGGGPALGSPTGSGTPSDTGSDSLVRLGYVSEELASALRDARTDLGLCYAERDSLTGK